MTEIAPGEKSQSDEGRRRQLYDEHRKQAWQDIQSSTDSFDRSLLTLSSGALAVSLAFIKDIVPLRQALCLGFLYVSWISFALCILLTVLSFRLSILAQNVYLEDLPKYYIERKEQFRDRKSGYSKALAAFTWLALCSFLIGLVCTVVFCTVNVASVHKMSDAKKISGQTPLKVIPTTTEMLVQEGRQPLAMTPVTPGQGNVEKAVAPSEGIVQKGRQPVQMTPVQSPAQTPATTVPGKPTPAGGSETPSQPPSRKKE